MQIKTFSIKGSIILCLLTGLTSFFLTSLSFVREPIRTVTDTVTKVSDGDTIHVSTPEQTKLTVRLYVMDAPETPKINQRTGTALCSIGLVSPIPLAIFSTFTPPVAPWLVKRGNRPG